MKGITRRDLNNYTAEENNLIENSRCGKKTPAYAVLITFLNLPIRWAPYCCFRLSTPVFTGCWQTCTPLTRKGPRFQGVGSKNEC